MAKFGVRVAAALSLSLVLAEGAAAIQVTLTVVQSQSTMRFRGDYGGTLASPSSPFYAQDDPTFPTADVTDGDPTRFSNQTTFQGTITVDVNSITAPTTIQILSANMPADVNGSWLPDIQPDSGGNSSDTPPTPAKPANFGIKLIAFGTDFAYGAVRNMAYNLATEVDPDGSCDNNLCPMGFAPAVEPVNGQGEFSSFSQHLFYRSGYFDTWQNPLLSDDRDRDDITGDGAMNQYLHFDNGTAIVQTPLPNAPKSTYVVSGNLVTLTLPINIAIEPGLAQYYDGQFVATYTIPAAGVAGDYNNNGVVDAADYVVWRKGGTLQNEVVTPGSATAGDYTEWRARFGNPPGSGSGLESSNSVPEPTGSALALAGLACSCFASRCKNKNR